MNPLFIVCFKLIYILKNCLDKIGNVCKIFICNNFYSTFSKFKLMADDRTNILIIRDNE